MAGCVVCVYRLLQGVAAAELLQLRVRAGPLAPVSASALARNVLLHAAIWQTHTPSRQAKTNTGGELNVYTEILTNARKHTH